MICQTFTLFQWFLAVVAAFCIGLSKSGFSGVGLLTVIIMARLFPSKESTGILLPLLIAGDILSVIVFHQHARWSHIWRMLPPTILGILAGYVVMQHIPGVAFRPLIGWIVLLMVILQAARQIAPRAFTHVPHAGWFAWTMGGWAGIATMLANAAGPIMSLYLLAIAVPKYELVGTSGWFFLLVNVFKVPFSAHLGLINSSTLLFNLLLLPIVAGGIFFGRRLIHLIPQTVFERLLLGFASIAALYLIGLF
ncbi:MAG: Sulfite exporter TauE/SafE [Chthoniobacteraceae bacterium]|nr:Sulfite exporter TauE/SafE [Chthoniobacteraceae bacterium]